MPTILFKLFTVFLLFSSSQSLLIVKNTTVSSDFFKEQFIKELRFISNKSEIIRSDDNALKCIRELQEIANRLPNMEVLPFIDSWGFLPSGVLYGHLIDFGNYDQCVETTVTLDETIGKITGQYCLASFPVDLSSIQPKRRDNMPFPQGISIEPRISFSSLEIQFGVCIPDTCSPQVTTQIFQNAMKKVLNGTLSDIKVAQCSVGKKPDYEAIDIFAIVFYSLIGLMMLLSTLYDVLTSHLEKEPVPLLLAFSIVTNGRKLFMINTKKSTKSIDCLTGIRVLSMIWVLYCHTYMLFGIMSVTNSLALFDWLNSIWSMTVGMGTVSVDSFFFLSGLLIAWLGLQELDKTNGKLNVVMMYVHRYVRLTPPVAAIILFYVSLNKYVGSGPLKNKFYDIMQNDCKNYWWTTLLYIQNYAYPNTVCISQSWYLAVDTQLYILSPLVLLALWKWGKKCIPAFIGLSLLSMGCVIATSIIEGYTDLKGLIGHLRMRKTYYPTHTRYPVWLVGICTGYFLHINRHRNLRPSMEIRLIGWILSLGTLLAVVFAPHATLKSSSEGSVGEATAYDALKHVSWGIAVAWIVVACHHGFGGIVNSILSHPFWQPLGRLAYCMYLVHYVVMTDNFGTVRTDSHFSDYSMTLEFWSNFGITLLVAIVLSLSFEAPILVIEKAIFGTTKPKGKSNEPVLIHASNGTPVAEHKEV